MEKITIQSSEEILEKGRHAFKDLPPLEEIAASLSRLSKPLKEIEYAGSGMADFEISDSKLEFKYGEVENHYRTGVVKYIDNVKHEMYIEDEDPASDPQNWRRLTQMKLITDGKTTDLLRLFPINYPVFFCPFHRGVPNGAVMESKNVYLLGDIATPVTLLTFFHEMGHVWDEFKLNIMGQDYRVDDHKYSVLAEGMRKERAATSYALRVMRPFLKDEAQKADVVNLLKNYAMATHHHATEETIHRLKSFEIFTDEELGMLAEEDDPDAKIYLFAFKKWKETEAYERFKPQFFPEGSAPELEFKLWRDWVIENQYNFFKDISPDVNSFGDLLPDVVL